MAKKKWSFTSAHFLNDFRGISSEGGDCPCSVKGPLRKNVSFGQENGIPGLGEDLAIKLDK